MTGSNGMEVDPDDPDGVGLGGMMHGVHDEDGFGVDGTTTLEALGQEMVHGLEDDGRRHHEEDDQAGYHGHEQEHEHEHGHPQEDHLDHHPHPPYPDHHETEQDPDPDPDHSHYAHEERDPAFQGTDPRSSNVSDLRTRQDDESVGSVPVHVGVDGDGHGHGNENENENENGEQLEMSLNGAMAAAESMGMIPDVGELQGLDVGYMDEGDLEPAPGEVGVEEGEGRYDDIPLEHGQGREDVEQVEREHGEEQVEEEEEEAEREGQSRSGSCSEARRGVEKGN